ncbi:hypothetical protein Btru_023725 [Bulinus truncatus]|nr:hypothetical protein Btru_023725 [Bulinus truncatus]
MKSAVPPIPLTGAQLPGVRHLTVKLTPQVMYSPVLKCRREESETIANSSAVTAVDLFHHCAAPVKPLIPLFEPDIQRARRSVILVGVFTPSVLRWNVTSSFMTYGCMCHVVISDTKPRHRRRKFSKGGRHLDEDSAVS